MIRSFFRTGPLRSRFPRIFVWCLALALLAVPAVTFAANRGIVVTPLDEGGGDSAPSVQPGGQLGGQPGTGPAGTTDTAPGMAPGAEGGLMPEFPEQPSYKDGIIMAYLVELMRKQDKACPSGTRPPVPPSLLFSEPLCRVAESVGKGAEFPAAYDEQGIYAARWRMFSASDLPAQTVATRLRAEHCEALLEPYTHIGAWRSSSGWRIVLATLTDKPQTDPADPVAVPVVTGEPQAAVAPGAEPAVPAPAQTPETPPAPAAASAPAPTPGEAATAPEELVIAVPATASAAPAATPPAPVAEAAPTPDPASVPASGASVPAPTAAPAAAAAAAALPSLETIPDPVPDPNAAPTAPDTSGVVPFLAVQEPDANPVPAPVAPELVPAPAPLAPLAPVAPMAPMAQPQGGQEARALFSLINDLRVSGGSCLGKARVTAPPLAFSATLQSEAEKSAADAADKGSFGSLLGASQNQASGTSAYPGAKVSKLTAASRAPVSAVLDVWMVSPTRCDALLSSDFTDAGAAYVDGYWVVLLGQRAGSKAP